LVPVKFENISHRYNQDYVLKNVSLSVESDKITVIIGKSGSGKSTLLQMINGLVIPSEGTVKLFGESLNYDKINEVRLKIGYSVQGTNLFPHMTAYENITLPAKLTNKTQSEINARADALMNMVELPSSYKNKYPYQLSGGEQQRVGICRAMLLDPPIFLLDEAFGALDPEVKNDIHTEMLKVQKAEPRTIIMVTHDMREAGRLADNIVFLEKGEIQQTGTKDEVLNNPVNEFVKRFITIY
jgi:osmoprotectant transport system ATP-binding protein